MGTDVYRDGMARLAAGDVGEGRRLLEEALVISPGDVEVMHGAGARAGPRGGARPGAGAAGARQCPRPGRS
ncbi:hypothetical protein ACLESD_48475, partial [Pyxidicoccus sp. 3LFB2]